MGEDRHRRFHGLSSLLMGAGLAVGAWGLWLAGRPPDVPASSVPIGSDPSFFGRPSPVWEAPALAPTEPSSPPPTPMAEREPPLRLRIPAIRLDAPVVPVGLTLIREGGREFITWAPPDRFAAGWLTTSAAPGQSGNVVLIGHHNIYGKVFADLHRLRPGQRVWLETRRGVHVYEVEAVHILPEKGQPLEVRQRNLRWILPTPDERLTLLTCWPPNDNTHRLIVVARPSARFGPRERMSH